MDPLAFRRALRRSSTEAERRLWRALRARQLGVKFRRQCEIGPFFVDFFCVDARLVVELDGGQHYEEENARADRERDRWLAERGIAVLRFTNLEVMREIDAVIAAIDEALTRRHARRNGRPSP